MSLVGRCAVCFSTLFSSSVVALTRCGHTFHDNCVRPWLSTGKACPTCRTRTTSNDIVKLYFDAPGPDDSFFPVTQEDNSAKIAQLHSRIEELEKEKDVEYRKSREFEEKIKSQSRTIVNLEKNAKKAERLSIMISQLEGSLQNQNALQKKLEETERKLKASEFYRLIKAGDGNDAIWENYLGPKGSVNPAGFEALFHTQYKQLRRKYDEQQAELASTAKLLAEEKRKKEANQKVILDLRDQLKKAEQRLAERNVILTPREALRDILAYSPPKDRRSLGFSLDDSADVVPHSKEIIVSAMKKRGMEIRKNDESRPPLVKKSKRIETEKNRFTFDDSDDDFENIIGHFDVPTPISRFGGNQKIKPFSTAVEDKFPSIKKGKLDETLASGPKPKSFLPLTKTKSMSTYTKKTNTNKPPTSTTKDDSVICLS